MSSFIRTEYKNIKHFILTLVHEEDHEADPTSAGFV